MGILDNLKQDIGDLVSVIAEDMKKNKLMPDDILVKLAYPIIGNFSVEHKEKLKEKYGDSLNIKAATKLSIYTNIAVYPVFNFGIFGMLGYGVGHPLLWASIGAAIGFVKSAVEANPRFERCNRGDYCGSFSGNLFSKIALYFGSVSERMKAKKEARYGAPRSYAKAEDKSGNDVGSKWEQRMKDFQASRNYNRMDFEIDFDKLKEYRPGAKRPALENKNSGNLPEHSKTIYL